MGKDPRDGPGRLRAGCGGTEGTARVPPDAVVAHPSKVAAVRARGARSQPGLYVLLSTSEQMCPPGLNEARKD